MNNNKKNNNNTNNNNTNNDNNSSSIYIYIYIYIYIAFSLSSRSRASSSVASVLAKQKRAKRVLTPPTPISVFCFSEPANLLLATPTGCQSAVPNIRACGDASRRRNADERGEGYGAIASFGARLVSSRLVSSVVSNSAEEMSKRKKTSGLKQLQRNGCRVNP